MVRRQAAEPRTEILHVRFSPEERERLKAAADAEYLDQSAWARRAILLALDAQQRQQNATPRPRDAAGRDTPPSPASSGARRR